MITIKLGEMLAIQKELNDKIKKTQKVTYEDIKYKSRLALMAELMELCNETRCFNYWSKKCRSNDSIILEEFADVICFTLTECIEYGLFTDNDELLIYDDKISKINNHHITTLFLELIKTYSKMVDKESCKEFVSQLFHLGFKLGYTFEQILNAYKLKCLKNHSVQDDFKK